MRRRYYVINGYMACSKADEARIDRLMPKNFTGNAVEKLLREGYVLDEGAGKLFSPDGKMVAYFTEVR